MEPKSAAFEDFGLPSSSVLQGIMDDLKKSMERIPDTQEQMLELSGTAWSEDRMVKVVVGPRGQLVDLEIDPRVLRNPDTQTLRSTILTTNEQAVREVVTQAHELMAGQIPPEVAELQGQYNVESDDMASQMLKTDAEIMAERKGDNGW
ncbi:hypothetical protein SAMN05216266_11097 [Amycolatopsis marina]|uniref:YbaB/EbfC DNA-binding family protein n=1 Tax=Amycolatopsis marina TaxID=490629 RepID=A0A1I1ARG4_9PSEU|nr:YbaB/EbfC family nucleoid-associated protein [Amycolatopsis marina]SFB40645.1 hypothetical protein SAMN05216266_11097 [Amycolatopsis marina]